MNCKKCGKEISDDSTFCPYCGSRILGDVKSKRILVSVLIILLSICSIIVISLYLFGGNKNKMNTKNSKQDTNNNINGDVIYQAYKNVVEEANEEANSNSSEMMIMDVEYGLVDINNDNVKELILFKGTSSSDYEFIFYTYKENEVTKLGELSAPSSVIYKMNNENYLRIVNSRGGSEQVWNVYFSDGNFQVKDLGYRELSFEDEMNGNFTVGDEMINLYDGTDLSKLNTLK